MVTPPRIRKGARVHYYIKEWMDHKHVSGQDMAGRLNLSSRSSVWKLHNEQHRLTPGKVAQIADALGITPHDLQFPPEVPSLDALAQEATPEQRAAMVSDIVRRMRAS